MKAPGSSKVGRWLHCGRLRGGLLLALALAVAAGTSRAAAAEPVSAGARKEARAHFARARAFQESGAYDQAIAEYQASYLLAPLPDLIFNLAQCARLKGDRRSALAGYSRYLALAPDGRGAADARKQVAQLNREIAQEEARLAAQHAIQERPATEAAPAPTAAAAQQPASAEQPPPTPVVPPPPAPAIAAQPPPSAAAPPPAPASPPPSKEEASPTPAPFVPESAAPPGVAASSSPAPTESRGRTLRVTGLVAGGVGVALIAGGIAFGIHAHNISNQLRSLSTQPDPVWDQGLHDAGVSSQRNMFVLLGAGTAAVAAGAICYGLGRRAQREDTAALQVTRLPGGGVLALITRF